MACPTCDHAMESLPTVPTIWVCPRCGTYHGGGVPQVPKLVEWCRKIEAITIARAKDGVIVIDYRAVLREWEINGIAESIHRPEDRP